MLDGFEEVLSGKKGKDLEMAKGVLSDLSNEIFRAIDDSGEGELDWNEFKTYKSVKGEKQKEILAQLANVD